MMRCFFGSQMVFAIADDDSVWVIGNNRFGRAGIGLLQADEEITAFTQTRGLPPGKIKNIAIGNTHVLVVMEDGSVYGAGDNSAGQLGLTGVKQQLTFAPLLPHVFVVEAAIGGDAGSWLRTRDGKLLVAGSPQLQLGLIGPRVVPSKFILATQLSVEKIAAVDAYHYFIVVKNAQNKAVLLAAGTQNQGELGVATPNFQPLKSFTPVTGLPEDWDDINVWIFGNHTLAFANGQIYEAGDPQLSSDTGGCRFHQVRGLPESSDMMFAGNYLYTMVLVRGKLFNFSSQFTRAFNNTRICAADNFATLSLPFCKQVAVGGHHDAVLTDSGVLVRGQNDRGQLGLGALEYCPNFTPLENLPNDQIVQIGASGDNTYLAAQEWVAIAGSGFGGNKKQLFKIFRVPRMQGRILSSILSNWQSIPTLDKLIPCRS